MSIRDLINELALFDNEPERELPRPDDAQRRFPGYRPLHEDTYQRPRPVPTSQVRTVQGVSRAYIASALALFVIVSALLGVGLAAWLLA